MLGQLSIYILYGMLSIRGPVAGWAWLLPFFVPNGVLGQLSIFSMECSLEEELNTGWTWLLPVSVPKGVLGQLSIEVHSLWNVVYKKSCSCGLALVTPYFCTKRRARPTLYTHSLWNVVNKKSWLRAGSGYLLPVSVPNGVLGQISIFSMACCL